MIYDDTGSETVFLADTGAELTSMKKEALAFDEEKVDLSADSSSDMRHLQNPIYATSLFTAAPKPSEDRTLYNPVYEAVAAEKKPDDGGDDLPEKVMPSPEDFVVLDDPNPLVATTTATGTTTVHANGEKYEPAAPVPIEVEDEPQYATVVPKHKRATAKPFAADEYESDGD
jgi:hypothetical protein